MKLSELKLNPNNPQVFDDLSKLENSIKEFPKMMELRPLVVDSESVVLGGNKRLICLQNLGYKEIPNEWVKQAETLTEEEKKRFVIADNVGFGEWDWEMLQKDFDVEELAEWGLESGDFEGEIEDIQEVEEFTESVNFAIKCDNLEQIEELQTKLGVNSTKIKYKDFLIKVAL